MKRISFLTSGYFFILTGLLIAPPMLWANVFPSDIRFNGELTNATVATGSQVEISYILNEPATRGVTIDVLQGPIVVRRMALTAGPGTNAGLTRVNWDLRDNASNLVPAGSYSVRVTAAAEGYQGWTQTSDEAANNTLVFDGHGIGSLQSVTSPYFGRLVLGDSAAGDPTNPGHIIGLVKLNADGSPAEEGANSTGGHDWSGNYVSPWKVETHGDYVYANDLALSGQLFRWDATISSNTVTPVLRVDNIPAGASLGGFALFGQSSGAKLFMADGASNLGIVQWNLGTDGTCANGDTGKTVIGLSADPQPAGLSLPPQDVAVDPAGNFYVCQSVNTQGSPLQRVFRFPAYDPSTNAGLPLLNPTWAVGANDDSYGGASGIAVDPTGTYVAVAFQGVSVFGLPLGGNTKILYASNGMLVTNLDLHLVISGDSTHQDTDCAWDAAGNVYYIDNWWGRWRAVSPPGTNQMSFTALATILVTGSSTISPEISGISVSNGVVRFTFTGSPTESVADFIVLSTPSLGAPYAVVQSATITATSPGVFAVTLPVSGSSQFYRVDRKTSQGQQPQIQGITVAAGTVNISFSAAASDAASDFGLLSAASPNGTFTLVQGAQFSGSGGTFHVTTTTNGPTRFYRIQR